MFSHKTDTKGNELFSNELTGPLEPCKVPTPSYTGVSFLGQKDEMEIKWLIESKHMDHTKSLLTNTQRSCPLVSLYE